MISKKKAIYADIVETIKRIKSVHIGSVTTKPVEIIKLARTSFPVVQVNIDGETSEDIATGIRLATLNITTNVYVQAKSKGSDVHDQLSDILEIIEEALEVDRTRNKKALLTEMTEVSDIEEHEYPIVSQQQSYVVQYYYDRGNR